MQAKEGRSSPLITKKDKPIGKKVIDMLGSTQKKNQEVRNLQIDLNAEKTKDVVKDIGITVLHETESSKIEDKSNKDKIPVKKNNNPTKSVDTITKYAGKE